MATVVGLFDDYASANGAYEALASAGYTTNDIGFVASESTLRSPQAFNEVGSRQSDTIASGEAAYDAERGAVTGGTIGGLAGLALGIAALAVPGIGPVLSAGALAAVAGSTAVGIAGGTVAGGVIGAIAGLGVGDDIAQGYMEGVRRGAVLLTVKARDGQEDEVRDMMRQWGAADVEERMAQWRAEGWSPSTR